MAGQLQWLRRCKCRTGRFTWHRQFWGLSSGWTLRFNKELASHYNFSLSQVKPKCPHLLYLDTYFQKLLFLKGPSVWLLTGPRAAMGGAITWKSLHKDCKWFPCSPSCISVATSTTAADDTLKPCLLQLCKEEHTNLHLGAAFMVLKFTKRE